MNQVKTQFYTFAADGGEEFFLQHGGSLSSVTVAYETYGQLSANKDNAILLFHALTGSQHAAGYNPAVKNVDFWSKECHAGWWEGFIGPGKALDTDKFFIICANYLGGCYGSTGPSSPHPDDGKPYGSRFPRVAANDIVDSQLRLLDHLGVETLHGALGGSLGGLLALNLAVRYPERVKIVIPIACGLTVTTLQRIHNFEQIYAIQEDPDFNGGDYYDGAGPEKGLALARMISHKTFVSLFSLAARARDEVSADNAQIGRYAIEHPMESYMLHQGRKLISRFDANSYFRIIDVWQQYDLVRDTGNKNLDAALQRCTAHRFLTFSIDSDVCFYPEEQTEMVRELQQAGVSCQHITVHSEKGHDSFLVEPEHFTPYIVSVLNSLD